MGKQNYIIYSEKDINGIRSAAKKAATVLDTLCRAARPGMNTLELDRLAGELIGASGGESAFYNYHGFPAQICISINDEVVHGIGRDDRIIKMGDLVSLDVGIRVDGYIGDTARTISVGPPVGQGCCTYVGHAKEFDCCNKRCGFKQHCKRHRSNRRKCSDPSRF